MRDQFKNYDRWRLASPEDVAYEREQNRIRESWLAERADDLRNRQKDEHETKRKEKQQ